MRQDTAFYFNKRGFDHGFARNHHHVYSGRKPFLVATEHFPDFAFGPVSLNSISYLFGCDDAQPFPARFIGKEKQEAKPVDSPLAPKVHHPLEQGTGQQPIFLGKGLFPHGQTVRLLRPLRRRLESTRRPAAVAIRARKPWVRLRFRLFG